MRPDRPVQIVTISREYGSGGGDIAQALGRAMGWRVIDRALIEEVARMLQHPVEDLSVLDEHVGGIVERMGSVFARGVPEYSFDVPFPAPDVIAQVEHSVLRDAVNALPFVAVGHGAQCIFHDRPDALRIRVGGPFEERAARVAERMGISLREAQTETRRIDVERHRYLKHHFRCEWTDPSLYDLQIDTGGIGIDEAVELIAGLVRRRASAPDEHGES
ncbi:MAG TPA: cytidylate kinase-like family protein [Longimicrobiaceae bacterium]|nr:cytidylate kinase-like family protein [Longimicrobiaceae bacterium]